MRKLNVTIVYNKAEDKILMCHRAKEPYKGLYNLVGGKLDENEGNMEAAYRELFEETGITKKDIVLIHLMDFRYHVSDIELQVYVGKLNREVTLVEEKNKLCWFNANSDFFDPAKFAGEGNIGHMIEQVKLYKENLFI